jgi:serine/threonine-protein kinase
MTDQPDRRGYETPLMADAETAFRRLMRFQVKVAVIFFVVVAVIVGIVVVVVVARANDSVVVPDVRGFNNVDVASTLNRVGLPSDYVSLERASRRVPIGRVIETDPAAGEEVDPDTVLQVIFSCGPPQPGFCEP